MINEMIIQQGCVFSKTLRVYNRTDQGRVPRDITGEVYLFTVKRYNDVLPDDSGALIKKTLSEHSLPFEGETNLTLTAEETNIPAGTYNQCRKTLLGLYT